MRPWLGGFFFLVLWSGFVIAQTPLGFVLDKAGLAGQGFRWSQTTGTIWKGRIDGLRIGVQPLGDIEIEAAPLAPSQRTPQI